MTEQQLLEIWITWIWSLDLRGKVRVTDVNLKVIDYKSFKATELNKKT